MDGGQLRNLLMRRSVNSKINNDYEMVLNLINQQSICKKAQGHTIQFYCFFKYHIPGNFCENGNFNNFTKNIFANDPCVQYKRHGIAIFCKI